MRLGVIGNRAYPDVELFLDRLVRTAAASGLTLVFEAAFADLVPGAEQLLPDSDIAGLITLGGDGTFLRGARALEGREIPILGINLGHLGFLTACGGDDVEVALQRFLRDDFVAEPRMLLEAHLSRSGVELERWHALNDVVLHAAGKARVIRMEVDANGERIADYPADGLIFATPTGSSAYSLSSGGPIVHPELESIVLTPISAHTLTIRPLLLAPTTTVTVRVQDELSEQALTVDGQESAEFVFGDVLTVRRSARRVRLVRFPETTFFARMRHKMGWGGS